jgi:AraC-like DNA-binding protein
MTPELAQIKDWAALARDNDYKVEPLAAACGVSMWCLNHFFLTQTCLHAHEWLAELKQVDALCLLARGLEIKDVADALGYSDRSHFGRAFKRILGMTPGQALEQHLDITDVISRKPLALFSLEQAIKNTAKNGQTNVLHRNADL